jgi:hypothetical protein
MASRAPRRIGKSAPSACACFLNALAKALQTQRLERAVCSINARVMNVLAPIKMGKWDESVQAWQN